MAKVTLVLEDRLKDGTEGLHVSLESDPEFPGDIDQETVAQRWGTELVNLILENCQDVTEVPDTKDPDITLN